MPGEGDLIAGYLVEVKLRRRLEDPRLDILLMIGYVLGRDDFVQRFSNANGRLMTIERVREDDGEVLYTLATNRFTMLDVEDSVFGASILPSKEIVFIHYESGNWERELLGWYLDTRIKLLTAPLDETE